MQFLTFVINNVEIVVAIVGGIIAFFIVKKLAGHKRYDDSVTEFILQTNRIKKVIADRNKPLNARK